MNREVRASLMMAARLKSLEVVGWSTVFPHAAGEPMSTKTYIGHSSLYGPAVSHEGGEDICVFDTTDDGACLLLDPFPPSVAGLDSGMELEAGNDADDDASLEMQATFRVARNVEVEGMRVVGIQRIV